MKARCPKCIISTRFITSAHVMQDWLVDETGMFLDVAQDGLEVSSPPNPLNLWICYECGASAIVEEG